MYPSFFPFFSYILFVLLGWRKCGVRTHGLFSGDGRHDQNGEGDQRSQHRALPPPYKETETLPRPE